MKILITGICGFVGSTLARAWAQGGGYTVYGVDNFVRPGSELNRRDLGTLGVKVFHADVRSASDFEALPDVDWVIDAAANPSVLAGVDGQTSSRQLVEHNLLGTLNMLEYCKARRAGFVLLSTSRVYNLEALSGLEVEAHERAYTLSAEQSFPVGISAEGVSELCATRSPVSLYGGTKLASETLALEYAHAFEMPVWVNRCGVLAGAGQFGKPDQGIFAYWINAYLRKAPLKYIGFDGMGHQVRDCLHPRDLVPLLDKQMAYTGTDKVRVQNVSGGVGSACSLRQLSSWCAKRFGQEHEVGVQKELRPFDIPWMVLDSSLAQKQWDWAPQTSLEDVLDEIATHAQANPEWLMISKT